MERRVMLAVVLAPAVMAAAAPVGGAAGDGPPAQDPKKPPQVAYEVVPVSERLEIDGRKNPELIPQWDVWHAAFEIMSRAPDLPTEVLKTLSTEEAASIRDAARENARNFQVAQERVLRLFPTLQTDEAKLVTERTQAINLEFRWQVLGLRDRVLAGLNPSGRVALSGYVESLKAGMRVFVAKKELAYYRQPQ
jgi:hypothetical protein